jgi:hypothetical protein
MDFLVSPPAKRHIHPEGAKARLPEDIQVHNIMKNRSLGDWIVSSTQGIASPPQGIASLALAMTGGRTGAFAR